jgi:hypothetical protein
LWHGPPGTREEGRVLEHGLERASLDLVPMLTDDLDAAVEL